MAYERQLERAREFLKEELGEDWVEQVEDMDLASKRRLVLAMKEGEVASITTVFTGLLGMSGRDLPKTEEEKEKVREDEEAAEEIRSARKRAEKPIEKKEIEDMAWFHNLLHDLGKYAYHKMVKHVDWSRKAVEDQEEAFQLMAAYVDGLMEGREEIKKVQDIKTQRDLFEMQKDYILGVMDNVAIELKKCQWLNNMMKQVMCPKCKGRVINRLITSGALNWAPETREAA